MTSTKPYEERLLLGGILTGEEIHRRIHTSRLHEKIFVTPLIDKNQQIGPVSLDVRLGTEFIVFRRTKYSLIDVLRDEGSSVERRIGEYQEKIFVQIGKHLVLHPQQLVLGSTLEYVRLPNDLIAEVIGRSSWGRAGLLIATATLVGPGFAGVITLELTNEGDAPIALYPGARIAQLVFHKLITKEKIKPRLLTTKYIGATGPSFSKLHEDKDWKVIKKLRRSYRKI